MVAVTALKEGSGLDMTEAGKGFSVVVKTVAISVDSSAAPQFK